MPTPFGAEASYRKWKTRQLETVRHVQDTNPIHVSGSFIVSAVSGHLTAKIHLRILRLTLW